MTHRLVVLEVLEVDGAGEDEDVGHVHDARHVGDGLLDGQPLTRRQHLNLALQTLRAL